MVAKIFMNLVTVNVCLKWSFLWLKKSTLKPFWRTCMYHHHAEKYQDLIILALAACPASPVHINYTTWIKSSIFFVFCVGCRCPLSMPWTCRLWSLMCRPLWWRRIKSSWLGENSSLGVFLCTAAFLEWHLSVSCTVSSLCFPTYFDLKGHLNC